MVLPIKYLDRICLVSLFALSVAGALLVVTTGAQQEKEIALEKAYISKRSKDIGLAEAMVQRISSSMESRKQVAVRLNERIPDSSELGGLLKEMGVLMKKKELTLISIQPLSEMKERLFTRVPVRMIFKGSSPRVYELLHELETMKRIFLVEKMVISREDRAEECQVDLIASIFRR